jgi:hypothetical protein
MIVVLVVFTATVEFCQDQRTRVQSALAASIIRIVSTNLPEYPRVFPLGRIDVVRSVSMTEDSDMVRHGRLPHLREELLPDLEIERGSSRDVVLTDVSHRQVEAASGCSQRAVLSGGETRRTVLCLASTRPMIYVTSVTHHAEIGYSFA